MSNSIGELLKLKRSEKKYTLEMVANRVGVSINYISKLEKGENSNPSDDIIVSLATTLGIDEDYLFNSFGKIPLSTRQVLQMHPTLSKAISQISGFEGLTDEEKAEFIERTINWYKSISKREDGKGE